MYIEIDVPKYIHIYTLHRELERGRIHTLSFAKTNENINGISPKKEKLYVLYLVNETKKISKEKNQHREIES